jgi:hypothetical protein
MGDYGMGPERYHGASAGGVLMKKVLMFLAVTAVACNGYVTPSEQPEEVSSAVRCEPRSGNYTVSYRKVYGDCPQIAERKYSACDQHWCMPYSASKVGAENYSGSPCNGVTNLAANNCSADFHQTCPQDSGPGWVTATGKVLWKPDGSVGKVLETQEVYQDGKVSCQAAYEVTLTKIQ